MFSEVLKIIPKLDSGDLNKMERQLSSRFTKVAKGFGKGLAAVFKGGAFLSLATAVIAKLLSPLKEVQASIEKSLADSDTIVTNAQQFNTTPANLAKLQAFGASTGLSAQDLNMMLSKFQNTVAEAQADPTKRTAVRQFTGKDTAQEFFSFIQSLRKLDTSKQVLAQQEVFGEKQILKMSDFLNSDFSGFAKKIAGISDKSVNAALLKQTALNDYKDSSTAAREYSDIVTKGRVINKGTVASIEASKQRQLDVENGRIKSFQDINAMNESMAKMAEQLEKIARDVFTQLPIIVTGMNKAIELIGDSVAGWGLLIKTLKESRLFKGVGSLFGGKGE